MDPSVERHEIEDWLAAEAELLAEVEAMKGLPPETCVARAGADIIGDAEPGPPTQRERRSHCALPSRGPLRCDEDLTRT